MACFPLHITHYDVYFASHVLPIGGRGDCQRILYCNFMPEILDVENWMKKYTCVMRNIPNASVVVSCADFHMTRNMLLHKWVFFFLMLLGHILFHYDVLLSFLGFLCGSAGKESACNVRDLGSIPGLGRSLGERKSYPLQYSGLENSTDCIVPGVTNSRTGLSNFHFHFHYHFGSFVMCSYFFTHLLSWLFLRDLREGMLL